MNSATPSTKPTASPARLRDLVKSLEAGQTWYQASWCVPDVGRVYGPACSSHRAATLTVPAFSSDRDPLIYEAKSKADLRKQTAFLYTPDRRSPTTEWAMGEREGREEWEAEQRARRAGPPPPEVCPFCKSPAGFGNYHGMLYTLCSSEACKLRMVLIDGEWKPDPSSGNETARIWASNPLLSGADSLIAEGGWSPETEAALGRACCRYHAAKGTRPSCGNATPEELHDDGPPSGREEDPIREPWGPAQ